MERGPQRQLEYLEPYPFSHYPRSDPPHFSLDATFLSFAYSHGFPEHTFYYRACRSWQGGGFLSLTQLSPPVSCSTSLSCFKPRLLASVFSVVCVPVGEGGWAARGAHPSRVSGSSAHRTPPTARCHPSSFLLPSNGVSAHSHACLRFSSLLRTCGSSQFTFYICRYIL